MYLIKPTHIIEINDDEISCPQLDIPRTSNTSKTDHSKQIRPFADDRLLINTKCLLKCSISLRSIGM